MRSPLVSSRGPPELPGLMAASVWITFSIGRPVFPELISLPATTSAPSPLPQMSLPANASKFLAAVATYLHQREAPQEDGGSSWVHLCR